MQKGFAITVLLCCAAGICRAVDTNTRERVLLDYMNKVTVLPRATILNSTDAG